jgi:glycosyltransferase involved in cell wall biosynthesis
MNIGIDISQMVYEGTGVARFTRGLLKAILEYDNKNHWLFFFSGLRRKIDPEIKKQILRNGHDLVVWPVPPKGLSLLWNDWHRLGIAPKRINNLDLFITSDWAEPLIPNVKKATIVHDLVFKRYPETVEANILKTQEKRLNWVTRESDLIFADSIATRDDLVGFYKLDEKKIIVNYPGVEVTRPDAINNKPRPFILTVGKIEPRKNLDRLVKAFNMMDNRDLDLVIAGPSGWQTLSPDFNRPNIKVLKFVSDQELYSLYTTSLFFVYPSLWEGFGIPVIEAMMLGTPVTCSNTSSIREVAGDAALLFDPENTNDILTALKKMTGDEPLRKELVKKGVKNATKFTWNNYYVKMMKSIYGNRS